MSKREFITDVYDNLMKNTQYKPTDFSKIKEESWFDCAKGEIHIGNFVLSIKEQNNEPSNWHKLETELKQLKQGENMEKNQIWIEQNCECGISEKTGKWSDEVFDLFGCNCETEQNQ